MVTQFSNPQKGQRGIELSFAIFISANSVTATHRKQREQKIDSLIFILAPDNIEYELITPFRMLFLVFSIIFVARSV